MQPSESGSVVVRKKLRNNTEHYPGKARDDEPNAEHARQKSRAIDKQSIRKEPHTPEDLVDKLSLAVETEKKIGERVTLWFVEDRKKIGATEKNECGDAVQRVEKCNRSRN